MGGCTSKPSHTSATQVSLADVSLNTESDLKKKPVRRGSTAAEYRHAIAATIGTTANGGLQDGKGSPTKDVECSTRSTAAKLGDSGVTLTFAWLSQRGYYPENPGKLNQDALKIVPDFAGKRDQVLFGVFDGHGTDGDSCSYFVRDKIESELKQQVKTHPGNFETAYKQAFIQLDAQMHHHSAFDDSNSGTTAITAFFHGNRLTVANIGDSRAVLGKKNYGAHRTGQAVVAYAISTDQTPYRNDERERVKAAGAEVMSTAQKEGEIPYHENWSVDLGTEIDDGGDPPRIFAPGKGFPGCAFTRSIGDSIGAGLGVIAEPELHQRELAEEDTLLILASDGVWEFLTNQAVVDMIHTVQEPLDACRAVAAESYRLWLQHEERSDDITVIVIQIGQTEKCQIVESP